MHLLYADESGSPGDKNQKYFVLAGVSVPERQSYWLSKKLDEIAAGFNPIDPDKIELHGNPMLGGKGLWRHHKKEKRIKAIEDILQVLVNSDSSNRIFAAVLSKSRIQRSNPLETSFEQLSSRFDIAILNHS